MQRNKQEEILVVSVGFWNQASESVCYSRFLPQRNALSQSLGVYANAHDAATTRVR